LDIIDLRARFKKWLLMPEYSVVDVVLGCIVANIIPGEATNLYVVGPSGSGKTEVIRAMEGYHKTQAISRMTSTTLVSGFAKGGRASLLTKLNKKGKTIVLMKDFTTVLSMRPEVRTEILSQIREISDGKYDGFYGNDDSDDIKGVAWKGKLAFIAGVTNVIDEHHKVTQALGERFLYYRMPKDNPMAVATFAQNNAGLEEDMRRELTSGVRDFMADIKLHPVEQTPEMQRRLISLACMVASARSVVSKNPYTGVHNYEPQAEGPSRLIKQLSQLGSGIANVLCKDEVDDEVYDVLKKVAIDTLPGLRYKIISWMTSKGLTNGSMATTSQICDGINMSLNTTRHHLEDFESMEVVRKKVDGTTYSWGLTPMFVEYLKASRVI
jgi:hypothetical protein